MAAYSADALMRSRGFARSMPGEEWTGGPLGMSTATVEDLRASTQRAQLTKMWVEMKRRTRDIDIERELQNQEVVDMWVRIAQEKADQEFTSTRDSLLISREWNERYNGAATPPVASRSTEYWGTTRPRHTRLMSATRRNTYGELGYGLPSSEAELSA